MGLYGKNSAGMGQRGIPAYLVIDTFQAVGKLGLGLIRGIH